MKRLLRWLRATLWPDTTIRYPVYGPHPTVAFAWRMVQRDITVAYDTRIEEWDFL